MTTTVRHSNFLGGKSATFVLKMQSAKAVDDNRLRMRIVSEVEKAVKDIDPEAKNVYLYYVGDKINGFKVEPLGKAS